MGAEGQARGRTPHFLFSIVQCLSSKRAATDAVGEWDARRNATTEILHVVQNDDLGVRRNSAACGAIFCCGRQKLTTESTEEEREHGVGRANERPWEA